jgi:hypothetical protein
VKLEEERKQMLLEINRLKLELDGVKNDLLIVKADYDEIKEKLAKREESDMLLLASQISKCLRHRIVAAAKEKMSADERQRFLDCANNPVEFCSEASINELFNSTKNTGAWNVIDGLLTQIKPIAQKVAPFIKSNWQLATYLDSTVATQSRKRVPPAHPTKDIDGNDFKNAQDLVTGLIATQDPQKLDADAQIACAFAKMLGKVVEGNQPNAPLLFDLWKSPDSLF